MSTIYQRTQLFQLRSGFKFGRRKYKAICNSVTRLFHRKHPEEILPLVESVEGENVFQVNDYPDRFITVIDGILFRYAAQTKANLQAAEAAKLNKKQKPVPFEAVPINTPKQRKRKPLPTNPKPIFSSRNLK